MASRKATFKPSSAVWAVVNACIWASASASIVAANERTSANVMVDANGRVLEGSRQRRRMQAEPTNVDLSGFFKPTSFHWMPDQSKVFVAEKAGLIYRLDGFTGTKANAVVVLDIQNQVFNWGDHGLLAVWVDVTGAPFIYATYMLTDPNNPNLENTCVDYGQFDGTRTMAQMNGCATWGRFSRWPINANGDIVGAEQILMDGYQIITVDGESTYLMCAQFSTHSVTSIAQNPENGMLYYSAGDGAAFTNTDYGQMGAANPCMDRNGYRGAFRVQDPVRVNGKVMEFNPETMQTRVFTTGHRNPWRIHWDVYRNRLLEAETGWYSYEEINVLEEGKNYGWPCFEGLELSPHYNDPNEAGQPFFGNPTCQYLATTDSWARPYFSYAHPKPPPPNNVLSISAVAADSEGIIYGDITLQTLDVLSAQNNDQIIARNVYPCELRVLLDGTVAFVDHEQGFIRTALFNEVATASTTPTPPRVWIEASQEAWVHNSGTELTYTARSTIEGREGLFFTWNATLVSCSKDLASMCTIQPLVINRQNPILTITSPSNQGTLILNMEARSYGGFALAAQTFRVASIGSSCTCPEAGVPGGGGGVGGSTSFNLLSSPAALGGIIAAAAVVGIGAIVLIAWYAGLPQRLGMGSTSTSSTSADASRRPAPARAAGTDAHPAETTAAASIAQRRGLPKTPKLGPDVGSAPSNVVPITPQGPTPLGDKRV